MTDLPPKLRTGGRHGGPEADRSPARGEEIAGRFRRGVRLGVDVGSVRIGISSCDRDGLLSTPVETVARGRGDLDRIVELVADLDAVEVVVGLPTTLAGRAGQADESARAFAVSLDAALREHGSTATVRLVDERLSTVAAERALRESTIRGRKRRAVIDQAAAVVILQHALDSERATGRAPGVVVERVR